ncbi:MULTISPECIES: TraB/VirB10 family protein [Caballeronia]|uniref:Type VI secretion protein n=1 Tax=Caballeronia zhejiangensis TaxID=871203 RepID=A0A656QEL8_9BURK|nr:MULTISPECIES: TraB/VirB10 family protein [Caballeronia]KDR25595.1 type VI secretion protein [Caballeronia zhejiangensis]MCE4548002.1 TraB/VirB10 family protein [Caballeronia sp. PC1]MCE4575707.1 TraB/VirB10 family protein [Caballeronia sp. CLC5]
MALEWQWLDQKKQEWNDMQPGFRYLLIAVTVLGTAFITYNHFTRRPPQTSTSAALPAQTVAMPTPAAAPATGASAPTFTGVVGNVLPSSPRNQGLENVVTDIESLKSQLAALQRQQGGNPAPGVVNTPFKASAPAPTTPATDSQGSNPLGKDLPEAVSFDQPGSRAKARPIDASGVTASADAAAPAPQVANLPPARPTMIADPVPARSSSDDDKRPDLVLPMYTGIEAVMLSGINARPSGSNGGGAAGSVTSALDVGAPFVSRVKGMAIMPNSWKASDLANCFVGGSATAVLSAERAYGIADHISCIFKNGDVYEAPMKAYALDVDGTLGLAGKVVNKQGAMLMQAALTGMAAGLGAALAPSAVPSYNTNVGSGSEQSYTYPSPSYLAGTAVGQGINHAATELSQFYLNFAKETFPVVEVTAGTRVTWILKENLVLKKRLVNKEAVQ